MEFKEFYMGSEKGHKELSKFINKKNIKIKYICGSQKGIAGYIYIFYEES